MFMKKGNFKSMNSRAIKNVLRKTMKFHALKNYCSTKYNDFTVIHVHVVVFSFVISQVLMSAVQRKENINKQ